MKVLIIEDEERIRNLLKLYLNRENFMIETADNGDIGLAMALERDYDVILLDVLLPEKNGIEVLKELRTKKVTPVIMLTAQADDKYINKAVDEGANGYIVKPFSPKEVIKLISQLESIGQV